MLKNLTIEGTAKLLNNKKISAFEIANSYIKEIKDSKKLNCFITISEEAAFDAAKKTDARISENKKIGLLDGVPLAYKDLFCTDNILTTASSKILSNFTPTYESTVTANCNNQGAVVLGKLNCDEFAMGSTNKTSFYGPVINPWKSSDKDDELVPGGSSGGSAAAVAADLCVASLGTDTGGSIRQPASFTGLVGLKPTYGRVSRWGTVAFASSLDQAGPISKTVEDAAILLEAISGHDNKDSKKLNCFITISEEAAFDAAKKTDARISENKKIGLLDGVPLAYKDLFCTDNILTTASSKILSNFTPTYESTVTANCKNQGAVVLGKLNCDEFAMGSTNKTSFYGPVINPWKSSDKDDELVPGGSSGGSAAAVAADLCVASLGTDTGGSIRQPASFTGLVGLKPTYGRVSRWGTVAFASSLDQAGPISKTVEDAAILLEAISGHDNKDSTSSLKANEQFYANLNSSVKGLKIGVPKEYMSDDLPEEIQNFWNDGKKILAKNGAEIVEISLPSTSTALPAYYIIAPAEASSNLSRYDGVKYGLRVQEKNLIDMYESTRSEGFGNEVKRRIMIGTYVLSSGYYDAYYIKAQKIRSIIKNDFDSAFKNVDAIFTPATPNTAFPINREEVDPVQNYLNDIFTVPANLAGLPAISIPFGLDNSGLPIGMQLITNSFEEQMLLNIAKNLQDTLNFNEQPTQWWK